jgi:hypothetical protein
MSSSPVLSGARVMLYLVLYVCFVGRCLSFCTFSFGHCIVCSSSIYGFWLPLCYLQTLLPVKSNTTSALYFGKCKYNLIMTGYNLKWQSVKQSYFLSCCNISKTILKWKLDIYSISKMSKIIGKSEMFCCIKYVHII